MLKKTALLPFKRFGAGERHGRGQCGGEGGQDDRTRALHGGFHHRIEGAQPRLLVVVDLADQAGAPLSPEAAAWLSGISFQKLLGYLFAPVMFLIGISDWDQAQIAGGLFGTKIVLNEFVAFIDLGKMQAGELTERSRAIVTFALCGFANFSSIAIQMAVTGGLAPNQRPMIAKLGLKALLAGSLSNLMSAALAGLRPVVARPCRPRGQTYIVWVGLSPPVRPARIVSILLRTVSPPKAPFQLPGSSRRASSVVSRCSRPRSCHRCRCWRRPICAASAASVTS